MPKNKTLHQVWLLGLAKLVKKDLIPEYDLETVASYGFPTGKNADSVRGACYHPKKKGGRKVIFVHPAEWSDGRDVVRTFLHEAVHSVLPPDADHGDQFQSLAARIGLVGELRDGLNKTLEDWTKNALSILPPIPSDPLGRSPGENKPQKGRLKRFVCSCGFIVYCGREQLEARCSLCGTDFELRPTNGKGGE